MLRLFCAFVLFALNAFAVDGVLENVNKRLSSMQNITVKFRQVVAGQSKQEHGTIYFKKNEGILVRYETQPIAMLLNKTSITYFDSKLNQKSQIPTKDSAIKVLLEGLEINPSRFEIKEIESKEDVVLVALGFKKAPEEGTFKIYFSTQDYLPRKIEVISPENEVLIMDLHSYNESVISLERFKAINIEKAEI